MTFMAALTRSSGGPVLGVGGALGGQTSLALTLHRRTASICSDYSVRDSQSQKLLGFDRFGVNRARLIPDVAFAAANPQSGDIAEPVLTISLRCDRSPDMWRLAAVSSAAAANGVQPVIVTQVRRDQAQHERLASELGIEVCGWYDQTHAEQLRRIDKYYRRSVAVYSDRLHACILGARYGAKILNAEGASASKIRVTLSKLLEHPSGVVPRQYADVEDSEFSSERDARTIEMVRTAVATLESERRYLASGLRGQQVASTVRT